MPSNQPKQAVPFTTAIASAMVFASLLLAGSAHAAILTWDANTGTAGAQDGGGTWNTSGATWWNGGSDVVWPNTGADTAVFGAGSGSAGTVSVGTVSTNVLIFNPAGSGIYTLTSGAITLSGTNPTITANANAIISTNMSGTAGLTKSGTADLIITGSGAYTGTTAITAGTLQIGNGGNTGSLTSGGTISISGLGTLLYSETNSQSISSTISGSGSLAFTGANTTIFTLNGSNTGFTGNLNINRGVLSAVVNGGHFSAISVAPSGSFQLTGGTCSSPITISGILPSVSGSGALALAGANYSGSITLASSSGISESGGSATISGNISGPYQLALYATLGGVLTLSGSNTYGSTLMSGATVVLSGSNALSPGALSFANSGSLRLSGNSYSVASLSGSGQLQNGDALIPAVLTVGTDNSSTAFNGTIIDGSSATMGLTKTGSGLLALGGSNTFTGPTIISAGTLQMGNAAALLNSPVTINAGTLDVNGRNAAITSLGGSGTIALGSGSLAIGGNNASSTFSGIISGAGLLAKNGAGTLTLVGSSSFSGSTSLTNGILLLANPSGSALGSSTLTLSGGALASATVSGGSMSGAVVAGTSGHSISPGGDGGIGSLGVGGLTVNSLTTMRFDISSTSSFDKINDSGALAFSGSGAASILVPNGLAPGIYPLIGYSSSSSLSTANLSLGLIGGGAVPGNYLLQFNANALDLITGNSTNNSVLAASTSAVTLNRVMLNFVPSINVAIGLSSGTSATGFSISTSGNITASASGNGPGAIPPSGSVSIGLPNTIGSYNGAVLVQNSGDDGTGPGSAGAGQGYLQSPISIGVTGSVVANRAVTSSSASFSLIHLGQSVNQAISLTTTGSDSQNTRVTVADGGVDPNGLAVSGGSNVTFNSPTVTDSRVLGGAPNTAGVIKGTVTLTTSGEGLANESPINVSVPYSIQVFSGSGRFTGSSGSWAANGNWSDANGSGVHAAPGTWGFNDTAAFDGASPTTAIDLTGVNPKLSALSFSNSSYSLSNGSLTLNNGSGTAAVTVNGGTQSINTPMTLASNANFTINGGDLLLNATISGSGGFIKSGSVGLTLPESNTLTATGPITVAQGTLTAPFGISCGGGANVAAGATLVAAGQLKRAVSGAGTVTATDDLLIGASSQAGQFNQGGAPGVGGTFNIGGNAAVILSSDKAILGSQTNIDAGGSLTTLNGAQLGNPSSVDATKVLTASGSATINSNFVNNGIVHGPAGAGQELLFTQAVVGAGSTTGNVEYAASYRPSNSPNIVSVENVLFDPTNTLIMELAGTEPGTGYDQLDISGLATLDGTLEVTYLNGFEASAGDSFQLFDGATTGSFSQVDLPPLPSGLNWDTSALATSGVVSVAPEPSSFVLLATCVICILGLRVRRARVASK